MVGPSTIAELQRLIQEHEEHDCERFEQLGQAVETNHERLEAVERLIQRRLDVMLYTIIIIALGVFGKEFVLQIIDRVMAQGLPR